MKQYFPNFFKVRQHRIAGATLGLAIVAMSANAQRTIYDTTGGFTSYEGAGYVVGGIEGTTIAPVFSVSAPEYFSSVSLLLGPYSQAPTAVEYNVELTTDGNGQPGSVLDSWSVAGQSAIITLNANSADFLAAGNYDIVVGSVQGGLWEIDYSDSGLMYAYSANGNHSWTTYTNTPLPRMKIQVTDPALTPEPASLAAMGAGVLGLLLRRRFIRQK